MRVSPSFVISSRGQELAHTLRELQAKKIVARRVCGVWPEVCEVVDDVSGKLGVLELAGVHTHQVRYVLPG